MRSKSEEESEMINEIETRATTRWWQFDEICATKNTESVLSEREVSELPQMPLMMMAR